MIKILECYIYKPLMLLKVYGLSDSIEQEILIYKGEINLGKAKKSIWTANTEKLENGITNWVYTKVIDKIYEGGDYSVRIVNNEKKQIYITEIYPIVKDEIPLTFISNIGTKNNLTINEGRDIENDFIAKQEAYYYKPPVKHLTIESSSICNLKCKYCIVSNNYHAIERCVISKEVLKKAIDIVNRLYDKGLRLIQLNALGEPLTNPNFIEMIWTIYQETKIRDILFFSNGMLFSKEISDALAEIPMKFRIFFSLDGHSPEENEMCRKGSNYEEIRENIYYFLHKIAGKTNFTVKINNLLINHKSEKTVVPEFLLNDFGFIFIDSHNAFFFPELSRKVLRKEGISFYKRKEKKICRRIFNETTIRANGDVIRCHWDSTCEIVMGNILKDTFEDIWEGEEYVSLRKNMLYSTKIEELPLVCQHCHAMNNGFLYRKRWFWM